MPNRSYSMEDRTQAMFARKLDPVIQMAWNVWSAEVSSKRLYHKRCLALDRIQPHEEWTVLVKNGAQYWCDLSCKTIPMRSCTANKNDISDRFHLYFAGDLTTGKLTVLREDRLGLTKTELRAYAVDAYPDEVEVFGLIKGFIEWTCRQG